MYYHGDMDKAKKRCPVCTHMFLPNYVGRVCCSRECADARKGDFKDRFWRRVKKTKGCWEWQGRKESNGYARVKRENSRQAIGVHRLSWELHFGPIATGKLVCHTCDNRLCVRPDHLFLGTQKDNVQDMFKKGRANKARGSRHGMAKLSESDVRRIRSCYIAGVTQSALAEEYKVHVQTIHRIIARKRWRHSG